MRINNNIMAMNTHRQLSINNNSTSKSIEKLSSGYRINRAGDDAAGLAISEKMRAQIRGLTQASRNALDGISLIQTAEGALNESQSILQRMRELAVQSGNDTNVAIDRVAIQDEIDQLAKELSRISKTTEFNTQKLLNGDFEGTFQIGANEGQKISIAVNGMSDFDLGVTGQGSYETTVAAGVTQANTADFSNGVYTVGTTSGGKYVLLDSSGSIVAESDDGKTFTSKIGGADDTISVNGAKLKVGSSLTINGTEVKAIVYGTNSGLEAGEYTYDVTKNELRDENGKIVGKSTDDRVITDAEGNTIYEFAAAVTSNVTLDVGGLDVTTRADASSAISTINAAIEKVSKERAKLGSVQNRLEHTINNLDTSAENLQAAESRIRDVDMAKEMMEFTKNNILMQAAQAMLAQANMQPQGVLQLLR